MALANFSPTIWSARLLTALDRALVYAQAGIVNRDYEGEIRQFGDTVKINSIGDPTIKSYTRNTDIDTPEELTGAQTVLVIDQEKYFNFSVDDVDAAQANISVMEEAMRRTAWGLRNVVDSKISTDMAAAVPSANSVGTVASPKTISAAADVYNYLVDVSVKLDEADVPAEGRWIVVSPWLHGYLLKDDRFVKSGTSLGDSVLRNGEVGRAAGFTILQSNTVPYSSSTYKMIAGTNLAYSYAEQILKMEAFRPERRFSDAIKGLHVYGGKVIRPEALAMLVINKPA